MTPRSPEGKRDDETSHDSVGEQTSVDLLQRAKGGEDDALNRLLERYVPPLTAWASQRLPRWARDVMDTGDLVQETLLGTIRNLGHFQPQRDGALQAYLRQAVVNRIRDEVRRAQRRKPATDLDSGEPDRRPSPLEESIGLETLERYEAALESLPAIDREGIVARVELGQSWERVAEALGKPSPDAARNAVSRALKKLAREMAKNE